MLSATKLHQQKSLKFEKLKIVLKNFNIEIFKRLMKNNEIKFICHNHTTRGGRSGNVLIRIKVLEILSYWVLGQVHLHTGTCVGLETKFKQIVSPTSG